MQPQRRPIQPTLAQLIAKGATVEQIAAKAASTWRDIESALSPIIGQRATAALYKRSVSTICEDYPWMSVVGQSELQQDDFNVFQTTLSQQTSTNAAAAHTALLQAFLDLLTRLIGKALTERLLESIFETSSSADIVQETQS
jgi:hypothetical protein